MLELLKKYNLFTSRVVCFDDEPKSESSSDPMNDPTTGSDTFVDPTEGSKTFTQEDLNKFLASDRRKHEERYKQLEGSYKKLLEQKDLAAGDRRNLQEELEQLQKTFRTKEQQAEYEKKQIEAKYKSDLETATESAVLWESKYKQNMLDSSLQDAAAKGGAFNVDQITSILRPITKIVEVVDEAGENTGNFKPVIDFPDVDEKTGERIITGRTPEEAVQRMKELPDIYGNLFKANLTGGIGGSTDPVSGKPTDVAKMSYQQYKENRERVKKAH